MAFTWYLGTMGFGYKDWNGAFYPDGLAARHYLAYYSQRFNIVELDSTFYGTPRPAHVKRWAETTPDGFQFCAKTPKTITHELALVQAGDEMENFLETMRLLEDKLGVILLQFPPGFTAAQSDRLAGFLRRLPADIRYAAEFRHLSWYTPDTAALLASYGVCWTATAYTGMPQTIHPTTDFLYIRWIGQHGRFEHKNRQVLDPTPELQEWWEQIQAHRETVSTIFGFFNNDYAGHAPTTCNQFKAMVGLPHVSTRPLQQGRLFD